MLAVGRLPHRHLVALAFIAFAAFACVYAVVNVVIFGIFGRFIAYPLLSLVGSVRMLQSSVELHLSNTSIAAAFFFSAVLVQLHVQMQSTEDRSILTLPTSDSSG